MTDHRRRAYATADTLAAALVEGGVAGVIISPGSRCTPLALAVSDGGPPSEVVLDERSAGFTALGLARATGKPAAVICTSGSAAANYLPAVVEADRGRVPLVVVTADRPPGFLDRDAPQTIDQIGLYGSAVRASANLPVAHESDREWTAGEVLRVLGAAYPPNAGPVHLNVPFDKPLEPPEWRDTAPSFEMSLPESRDERVLGPSVETLEGFMDRADNGVMVVGPRQTGQAERDAVYRLAARSGWPILADGMSGLRSCVGENLVTTGDVLVGDRSFAALHTPDAVLRIGAMPTGTITQNWLEGLRAPEIVLDPDFRWRASGPEAVLRDPIAPLVDRVSPSQQDGIWTRAWRSAELRVRERRRYERTHHPDTELALTAEVLDNEALVWAGSSMPVRHVNAMLEPGCGAAVLGNRGACGIDGALASAAGAALGFGKRVTALLGDLTFLHDVGSLAAARSLGVDLSIVVLDNGGGAIFEMLPYLRSLRESGAEAAYQQARELFVTPHDQDLVAVAGGFGVAAERIGPTEMVGALRRARLRPGVSVLVVKTDPEAMFTAYRRLYRT
ncbi:MAG: 2-succinyl-5-enolpyruvyl-6-hydroxy-3-cyclohexene-1-carboxylic-acid synthase [bacterium]|nr:2-succinyl-5-enolpyruvyl-6-hydroxy-3-cyclohexene-1-carboxylic-acid synthase [bacterium]MDE0351270.1 2-succinyl-5-enolpyruvyl-6-hydroxy-3-cyclohexene-1-carboxylic-acid synthase [bacterium]